MSTSSCTKTATEGRGVSRRALVLFRQESYGSFTTEDTDIFHCPTLPKLVLPPVCNHGDADSEIQSSGEVNRLVRCRSKSVGALTARLKLDPGQQLPSSSVAENSSGRSVVDCDQTYSSANAGHGTSSIEVSISHEPPILPPRSPLGARKPAVCKPQMLLISTPETNKLPKGSDEARTVECELPADRDTTVLQPLIKCTSGHKLSHKEMGKLSRKLTHKMSCRQKQALMMDGEFDEFDELDVVVEGESDDEELSKHQMQPNNNNRKTSKANTDSDGSDIEFEHRITMKINFDRLHVDEVDASDVLHGVEMSKVHRIANELLCTERTYVKKLHLIDQVFHFEIIVRNREFHFFPDEVVPQIFSNIKSIYQFHNDFLLPQLEQRLAAWDMIPRIGDVMKKFAPFLKLYTDYVKNFDHAMEIINVWTEKSNKFASLLEELQKLPECGHLTLQHHMLEPIQRVPRYQLLLRDYLKHLEVDAVDQSDTETALALVSKAAVHSNEAMRKIEKFRKLLDINESLGDNIDLISPTRELIKEGKILRVSERDGDRYERYMMLFTDLLLVCNTLPVVIGSKQHYKIKSKIDIDGMEVCDGNNLEFANTFVVKGRQKSIELLACSVEEKAEWLVAIEDAIVEYTRKLLSRKANLQLDILNAQEIGKRAPTWIKDQETSMCMRCSDTFTTFRRRHHCRACGIVVCNKCSMRKVQLEYDDHRENRVCDDCYKILQCKYADSSGGVALSGESQPQHLKKKGPGFLHVKASDPSVICGYLNLSCDRRNWHRRWFAVHADFVLYSFKAHQDVIALTSMPLPGYRVSVVGGSSDGSDPQDKFRIYHRGDKKTYYFQADNRTIRNKWVEVLEKIVFMQLPDPVTSISPTSSTVSFRDVAHTLSAQQ